MKTIYILLTKSNTWLAKMIHLTTSDTYTHVSISFDESLQPLYSFSRIRIYTPLPAGLTNESFDSGYFKVNNTIPCALYSLVVDDDTYDKAKLEVESMMNNQTDYRFNILGLLLCRLHIPFRRRRHFFCSQFVGEILVSSKAVCLPKSPSIMRPQDYTLLPELTCLYKGSLVNLIK